MSDELSVSTTVEGTVQNACDEVSVVAERRGFAEVDEITIKPAVRETGFSSASNRRWKITLKGKGE